MSCMFVVDDALSFFDRCRSGLAPNGIIVIKENICDKGFIVDKAGALSIYRAALVVLKTFANRYSRGHAGHEHLHHTWHICC